MHLYAAADYPTTILADNPSAYYRLEETSGSTAADSSINGSSAAYTYNSANTYPQLGLPGIKTNSILFNGGGFSGDVGSVDIPASPLITPMQDDGIHGAPFSCELWVQPTAQPATYSVPIEMAQYPKGWNIYLSGADANGGTSYFYLNMPNGVLFQGFADFPVTFLRWYHLVVTFDGANVRFYINGVAHGPYAVSYVPAQFSNAHVGKGSGVGWTAFIGGVDEVAFYTNVLNQTQITSHYQVGTNSFRAVPTPPAIVSGPVSVTNFSGLPVSFHVTASGTLPLHYKWLKNGATVGPDSGAYTFTSQYPADNGATIQVVVTNTYGAATSDVATLTVSTDLIVAKAPDSINRSVGSYAAFRPIAYGAVPISYQWSRSTDGGNTYSPIAGATSPMLWVSNVQLADSGNMYSVQISNPFTSSNLAAGLTVQARAVNVPLTGYAQIVAADKPVAYWRLNEPDSTPGAVDAIGSFDGAYAIGTYSFQAPTGIPHWTNDPAVGMSAGAHIEVPFAPELNPDTTWSVETWFQPASLGADGGDYRIILSSEYNLYPNPYNGWYIYQQPNGTIAFVPQPGNGFIVAGPDDPSHGNVLVPGNWYHLVVTDDGLGFYVYINGKLRASFPVSGIAYIPNGTGVNADGSPGVTSGFGATVLGRRTDGAFNTFLGTMDETAIYNYALTPAQVQAHSAGSVWLTIKKTAATTVQLTWPVGVLQSATAAAGPYADVGGAASPYPHSSAGAPTYYRVRIAVP